MKISVENGKQSGFLGKNKIYIGRRNSYYGLLQSPLANPYVISETLLRRKVIELYQQWLWQQFKAWEQTGEINPVVEELLVMRDRLCRGEKIVLTCWCYPQPCHGDVIVKCLNWMLTQKF